MNLIPKNGEVFFYPEFFNQHESSMLFSSLLNNVPWKHEPITIFGKKVMQPRLTAWYADEGKGYTYSGLTMQPLAWNDALILVKEKIEKFTGHKFNSALLNQYRNEQDSVGWHRDNEKELGKNPVIASISFGSARTFHLKHYFEKDLKTSIELTDGSFLFMQGETQHYWQHSIPKLTKTVGTRINITFRSVI